MYTTQHIASNETCQLNLSKELPDSRSVVDTLCDYFYEPGLNETNYDYVLQFLSNLSTLTKSEKQKVLWKHKSNEQKEKVRQNQKNYKSIKNQALCESKQCKNRASMKRKYHELHSPQKAKKHEEQKRFKSATHDLDFYISKFHNRTKEGPYYICSVCQCLLYRKSVIILETKNDSSVPKSVFTNVASFDNKEYICKTCHSKLDKSKILCQAVYNDMFADEIPAELALLEKLEQILPSNA